MQYIEISQVEFDALDAARSLANVMEASAGKPEKQMLAQQLAVWQSKRDEWHDYMSRLAEPDGQDSGKADTACDSAGTY